MTEPKWTDSALRGVVRRNWHNYVLMTVLLVVTQVLLNRIDWTTKRAIDRLFGSALLPGHLVALLIGLAVGALLTRIGSRWFSIAASRDIEYELRRQYFQQLNTLGSATLTALPPGQLLSSAVAQLSQVRLLWGHGVMHIINTVFVCCGTLQVMLAISPRLSLLALTMVPVAVLATGLSSRVMYHRALQVILQQARVVEFVRSTLSGIRVIRSFGSEQHQLGRFSEVNAAYQRASLSFTWSSRLTGPIVSAVNAVGVLLCFWYGAWLLSKGPVHGGLTEGAFFAFLLSLGRLLSAMSTLGLVMSIVQRGRASSARIEEFLREQPLVVGGTASLPAPTVGALRVVDLSYRYADRLVLDRVCFTIGPGQSLAIVGRTGSGKTTLALLLGRLLPTARGAIFLDGMDVCDLPLQVVRSAIVLARQEAFLFSATAAYNIGFALHEPGTPPATDPIDQAARAVHLAEELAALPEQLDTMVGERGVQLSGGQQQRMALARAVLPTAPILLLDDPLSAVDAKTAEHIQDQLLPPPAQRSVIWITSRVAAAARCQHIIVLDHGRVVQSGSHAELLAQPGVYATLVQEQQPLTIPEELVAE